MKHGKIYSASLALAVVLAASGVAAAIGIEDVRPEVMKILRGLGVVNSSGTFTSTHTLAQTLTDGSTMSSGQSIGSDSGVDLRLGGGTASTDVAPGKAIVQGQNALASASTNVTGATAVVAGGLGAYKYTILSAAGCSGKTFTITCNGITIVGHGATVLTDGTSFTHSNVEATEATNLANAINANGTLSTYLTASTSGAVVYLTPKAGLWNLHIATNAGGGNATAYMGGTTASAATGAIGIGGDDVLLFREYPGQLSLTTSKSVASGYAQPGLTIYSELADRVSFAHYIFAGINVDYGTGDAEYTSSGQVLHVGTGGAYKLYLTTDWTDRWSVGATGHFLAETDNTYDIGASGATRPRTLYAGTSVVTPTVTATTLTGTVSTASQPNITSTGQLSALTCTRSISAKTSNYPLTTADSGKVLTTTGASGTVVFTLPTWASGLTYTLVSDAAQILTVTAPGSDVIRYGDAVTAGGGSLSTTTSGRGHSITLVATASGAWTVVAITGSTWN
jgi:hypothetical protein